MRTLVGPLSLLYSVALVVIYAFTWNTQWRPLSWSAITSDVMLLATVTAVVAIVITGFCMAIGGGAILLGRQWSVLLLNRSATSVVLALFCYFSMGVLLESLRETEDPARVVLARHWGIALSAAAIPLLVVWWTGRNANIPIEQLSWTWQQNKRRGRYMAGKCPHCGAMLNFASGDGVRTPADQPFKLFCSECDKELALKDVS